MKRKKVFICEKCGYTSPKWFGRCPECGEWNTAKEMILSRGEVFEASPLLPLSNVTSEKSERMKTGFSELDGALNGGIVPGQVILLAGEPGVGKSTLALEIADSFSRYGNVVYL
ncbi:MAG: DNA repair protein RadA, partial [Thermotoga sp.]